MNNHPITAASGPVAVTGASGYIGSHIVDRLVKNGYDVRACVRDVSNLHNTAHLSQIGAAGPGSVSLYSCELTQPGAYDEAFEDCVGVFHAAAEMGNLAGSTPKKVFDGGLTSTKLLVDSVLKAGTVQRLVYTSSFAAVAHPAPQGHLYTEDSWADMYKEQRGEGRQWDMDTIEHSREVAYAMTKVETERYLYQVADEQGFAAFGVCPCHVIGPLLSASHMRPWSWQTRIGDMLDGYGHPRMTWNIVDVRDVAEAQRLIAECATNVNGERYNLVCKDEDGLLKQDEMQEILRGFYPDVGIGGNYREGDTYRSPVSFLEKAVSQLGLAPYSARESIKDNADSLLAWGLVNPRKGVDNWQRDGNDLGIASKWSPHEYPAIDPDQKK